MSIYEDDGYIDALADEAVAEIQEKQEVAKQTIALIHQVKDPAIKHILNGIMFLIGHSS